MLRFLRIAWFTGRLYLLTHLLAFAILPIALLLELSGRRTDLQRLKTWFAGAVFRVVGQETRVSGLEQLDPQAHYVIVSNYPSGYALFALMRLFPGAVFVAHEFIARVPLLGGMLRRDGTIFVNARHPGKSYRAMDQALQSGLFSSVIILPEGGRTPDGEIHAFRRGFVHLLRQTGFDLLPITLNGFYTLKPANRVHLDPDTHLCLSIHAPIRAITLGGLSDPELIRKVECIIREQYRP